METQFRIEEFQTVYTDTGEQKITIEAYMNLLPRNFDELKIIIINNYLNSLNISDDIITIIKKHYPETII